MSLQRLDIYNVRNIQEQSILPSPKFNFFYGNNASGKSTLIESIFLLGRAKSFRTSSIRSVISFDNPELIVSGHINASKPSFSHIGIRMDGKNIEIRKNKHTNCTRSELAHTLPLQIIHPKSFELLDASSQIRREFLDWGIFNHEDGFLPVWKNYKKALAQRNALLKQKSVNQLPVWDQELNTYGTIVHQFRLKYAEKLKPVLNDTIGRFLSLHDFTLNLISGWDQEKLLSQSLAYDLDKDIRDGFTHSGPHRGDFQLMLSKKIAKDVVSRGQLKILVICLKLAQVKLMLKEQDYFGCILIDDFAAELDNENRAKLIQFLADMQCQIFLTATEKSDFGELNMIDDYKMFHVEHGQINHVCVPCETK